MAKGNTKASDKNMVDKVNQKLAAQEDSLFSRLLGVGLIIFGVLLVVLTVVLVILSKKEPKVDDSLTVPTVEAERYTNDKGVVVSGEIDEKAYVMVWVDDEVYGKNVKADEDGYWEMVVDLGEEGEYEISAATVKGFIFRKRSEKSDAIKVEVDTTSPSSSVDMTYDGTTNSNEFSLSGTAEEGGVKVILEGDKTYEVTADKDGNFEFQGVALEEGNNKFTVVLEDKAGNQKELARKVEVEYSPTSASLNGDGVSDTDDDGKDSPDIPEAAGELDAALGALFANKLMMIFALVGLVVLSGNTALVLNKVRK